MPPRAGGAPKAPSAGRKLNPQGQLDAQLSATGRAQARAEGRQRAIDRERKRAIDAEVQAGEESAYRVPVPPRSFPIPSIPTGGPVQTGSGIVLGIFGYAILLNWIRGGPSQVKSWLLAKLINKTTATASTGPLPWDAGGLAQKQLQDWLAAHPQAGTGQMGSVPR